MKTIVILHGINGFAGWQNRVSKQLSAKKYKVIMPVFPNWDHPDRKECLSVLKKSLSGLNLKNIILIGHSLGATVACDFLETIKIPIAKFISVSGFGEDYKEKLNSYFLKEKEINYKKVILHSNKRIIIYGDNDPYVPQKTLIKFASEINADDIYIVENGGHLSTGGGFTEFPLLIDLIEEE